MSKYPCCADLLVHVLLAWIVARELLFMIQVNLKCLDFCSQSQISNHMYMFSTSRNYENHWKNLIYRFGFVEAYVDFNLGNLRIISIWKWLLWTSKQAPIMMRLWKEKTFPFRTNVTTFCRLSQFQVEIFHVGLI